MKPGNVVFIIPTGIGCAIGGHAGDATPAARLIAETCDKLILHPNVVNASDINEMSNNSLYVEGSILDRFLRGKIELQEVHSNRILVVVNKPCLAETRNAINAARVTLGIDATILELETPLIMKGGITDGKAVGEVYGLVDLVQQIQGFDFDALAIATPIDVPEGIALDYFIDSDARVNPWGWVEAFVSRAVADAINKPVAHAPVESTDTKECSELFNILYTQVVDKRKAPEVCSSCYIHCILKGLHQAPRIGAGIYRSSVSALVTPFGCIGPPHEACFKAGIPVIAVEENTCAENKTDLRIIYVANYLEAAGVINCIHAGVSISSVRV